CCCSLFSCEAPRPRVEDETFGSVPTEALSGMTVRSVAGGGRHTAQYRRPRPAGINRGGGVPRRVHHLVPSDRRTEPARWRQEGSMAKTGRRALGWPASAMALERARSRVLAAQRVVDLAERAADGRSEGRDDRDARHED